MEELLSQLAAGGPVWVLCAILVWYVQKKDTDHDTQIMRIIDKHSEESNATIAAINELKVVVAELKERMVNKE